MAGMCEEASMRLMVVVLAMVLAGVAVAQEKELPEFAAMIPGMSGGLIVADYMDPAPKPKFGKLEAGEKLIAVQLLFATAKEVEKPVVINPMFAEIKCADMAVRNAAMVSGPEPKLSSVEMKEPKDETMGWVAFKIPEGLKAEDCKLNYGIMEKSRWIPLKAALVRNPPAEAPK